MPKDILDMVDRYLTDDQLEWGKLASNIHWRRLQLLLLREILVELRRLNRELLREQSAEQ